jgi:hypothetical protein
MSYQRYATSDPRQHQPTLPEKIVGKLAAGYHLMKQLDDADFHQPPPDEEQHPDRFLNSGPPKRQETIRPVNEDYVRTRAGGRLLSPEKYEELRDRAL